MGLWYRRKEKSNQGGMMKKLLIATCALAALASVAFGGTETYSGKQTAVQPPPCPEWYRDTEWNVSLWGTYLFTGSNWRDDQYLGVDHAWGVVATSNFSSIATLVSGSKVMLCPWEIIVAAVSLSVVKLLTSKLAIRAWSAASLARLPFGIRFRARDSHLTLSSAVVGSSVVEAVRYCCSTATATSSPNGTTIPKPKSLGSSVVALKFVSPRQSAG